MFGSATETARLLRAKWPAVVWDVIAARESNSQALQSDWVWNVIGSAAPVH
jgi:hypothetical protein